METFVWPVYHSRQIIFITPIFCVPFHVHLTSLISGIGWASLIQPRILQNLKLFECHMIHLASTWQAIVKMQGHKKYCMKLLLGCVCQVYYETYEFTFRFGTHPQGISLYVYIQVFQIKKSRRLLTLSISDKKYLVCSIILSALVLNMNRINKLYVIDI